MTTLEGSWLKFDQIKLEGPGGVKLKEYEKVYLRNVEPADYEVELDGIIGQPLLVDVEHLYEQAELSVFIDGKKNWQRQ